MKWRCRSRSCLPTSKDPGGHPAESILRAHAPRFFDRTAVPIPCCGKATAVALSALPTAIANAFDAKPLNPARSYLINAVSPDEGQFLAAYLVVTEHNLLKVRWGDFCEGNHVYTALRETFADYFAGKEVGLAAVTFFDHMEVDRQATLIFARLHVGVLFDLINDLRPRSLNFFSCSSWVYARQIGERFAAQDAPVPRRTCFADNVEVLQWPTRCSQHRPLRMFYAGSELAIYTPSFSPQMHSFVFPHVRELYGKESDGFPDADEHDLKVVDGNGVEVLVARAASAWPSRGVLWADTGAATGPGSLPKYGVDSDTVAKALLEALTGEHNPLALLLGNSFAQALQQRTDGPVPLTEAGAFYARLGPALEATVRDHPPSAFWPYHRAEHVLRQTDGSFTVRFANGPKACARGGRLPAPRGHARRRGPAWHHAATSSGGTPGVQRRAAGARGAHESAGLARLPRAAGLRDGGR